MRNVVIEVEDGKCILRDAVTGSYIRAYMKLETARKKAEQFADGGNVTVKEINKMTKEEFAKACESKAYSVLTCWAKSVVCYQDKSEFALREFVLKAEHTWGTAYCNWDSDVKARLYEELRKLGAKKIRGIFKWNYINISFDMK